MYCPGKENTVADFFSRNFSPDVQTYPHDIAIFKMQIVISRGNKSGIEKSIRQIFAEEPLQLEMGDIHKLQKDDINLKQIRENLADESQGKNFQLYNDVMFHNGGGQENQYWRVAIPKQFGGKLKDTVHQQFGHIGIYKTAKYMQQIYYWKGMNKDIRRRIWSCDICQRVKYSKNGKEI